MGAKKRAALLPVAVSIQDAAKCVGIPVRLIRQAIYEDGTLAAYGAGTNSIVRVRAVDLSEWIAATWPRSKIQRQIRKKRHEQAAPRT